MVRQNCHDILRFYHFTNIPSNYPHLNPLVSLPPSVILFVGKRTVRTYPGFACSEAVHSKEGAVELAELVGRVVTEEGDPQD